MIAWHIEKLTSSTHAHGRTQVVTLAEMHTRQCQTFCRMPAVAEVLRQLGGAWTANAAAAIATM